MKDFFKWIGVNEKIAKLIFWIFIIMIFLILTNTFLDSIGFSNYKITYDNLKQINVTAVTEYILVVIMAILNFYSIVLLIFRVKEAKRIFKYALLYLLLNIIIAWSGENLFLQVFIVVYVMIFSYFYSKKNWKYLIYGFLACAVNIIIQGVWYMSKIKFVDYTIINDTTRTLLSLDYFIIMGVIILVKEIYLNKRSERECLEGMENRDVYSGSETSKKKEH